MERFIEGRGVWEVFMVEGPKESVFGGWGENNIKWFDNLVE